MLALRKRFQLIDYMTVTFICINIVYIILAGENIEQAQSLVGGYALCLLATSVIIALGGPELYRPPTTRFIKAVRWFQGLLRQAYPLAMFAYFFLAVTFFDTAIFRSDLDPAFIAFEKSVFGSVPSSWLMIKYKSLLLSELLHGAYVLYYMSIPGLAFWLYVKKRHALPEYLVVAMLLFYVTCLTYAVLPVVGGRFDPDTKTLTELYRYGPFTRIMAFIYQTSGHKGAAFPSTHVIISLVIALVARKHARPLAHVLTVNAALVMVATVYCGYHYVSDLICAIVYVAVFYPLGLRLYLRYGMV